MKERLFELEEDIDFKKLEKMINDEVFKNIINCEDGINTEKWSSFPTVYLKDENIQNKIKEFVVFVDDMYISKAEKIDLILTLVYLIQRVGFDITNIDVNNIYLLVNYLNNESISELGNKLNAINDDELLYKIRCFSLDIAVREKLLKYVIENDITKDSLMKMILENDYYEMLEIIG